jgi:predicted amidohydrolase
MGHWKIAGVQMDCALGRKDDNLEQIRSHLQEAAKQGARLVIFPECVLTGYCFDSHEEALPHAEPVPGPSTEILAQDCRRLGVWLIVGMLETSPDAARMYNSCALVGPEGVRASYRKIHLPFLGVDRFTTPGDQPFAVHDLGGLRIGITICYDCSFPEAARSLMLQGADLIVLPTNWPPGARSTPRILVPARALENHVFFAAVDRVGEERGFRFIGRSRIVDCHGESLAASDDEQPTILYAEIDPQQARGKRLVNVPGKYELDRINDRRPEMYGVITRLQK